MAFPGTGKIWMNGALVDWKDATIHIASHVVHYGSGVFEGARCYSTPKGSACFRLDAHMRRLQESAKIYRMTYPLDLVRLRGGSRLQHRIMHPGRRQTAVDDPCPRLHAGPAQIHLQAGPLSAETRRVSVGTRVVVQ